MYYGNRTLDEWDEYYGIGEYDQEDQKLEDCKKIQQSFSDECIALTLMECKILWSIYSDDNFCSSWDNGVQALDSDNIFKLLLPLLRHIVRDSYRRLDTIQESIKERHNY